MLIDLKKYYNPDETNLVYLTIHQPGMVNALNSGAFSLQNDSTKKILSFALNLFNSFVNSQAEVRLNEGFQVYFKVLSYAHFQDPSNRRKTYTRTLGCKTDDFKMSGCVEIPDGFPENRAAFVNKCLLTSVILGFYCNEYYKTKYLVENPSKNKKTCNVSINRTHLNFEPLYSKRKKITDVQRNRAGFLLLKHLNKVIIDLKLDSEGPYESETCLPLLSNYFNCQIYILKSNQEKESLIQSFPEDNEWQSNLSQIFLYPKNDNHVVPILNLKTFCGKNRQFCPICKITFGRSYRHFCRFYEKSCFRCKSYYAQNDTMILPNLPFTYCFSKIDLEQLDIPIICRLCNYKFLTKQCYDNHRSVCGFDKATKSRIGKMCDKCNKFHNYKKDSKCVGSNEKKCWHCKLVYPSKEDHMCLLQKETLSSSWPKHIFFDFEFQNISSLTCTECYKLKKDYMAKNKIGLKEALKSRPFLEVKCEHHLTFKHSKMPNLCTIWKETNFGQFDRIVLASDDLKIENSHLKEVLSCNYDVQSINPSVLFHKPQKKRIRTETTNFMQQINVTKENRSVLDYFADFLLKNSWKNYVFVSLNHKTDNMSCVLEIFANLNLSPQVIRKGNRHIIINCESESLLFLNASNYFKGNYEDIAKQFNLNMLPVYFPTKLNSAKNSQLCGPIPAVEDFYDLMDSEDEKISKEVFVASFQNKEWKFREQLVKVSNYKTEIVARACLKFLKASIDFQIELKKNLDIDEILILHPFNRQVCTSPAFSYKMFSNYCLNTENVYSVIHESTSNMKQISQSEYEFVSFQEFLNPGEKFQHAFSSKEGQKKFGPYEVDLYSPVSKTVLQLHGCMVHLHDLDTCTDPNRKKMEKTDLSIYGKSKAQIDASENKMTDYLLKNWSNEVFKIKVLYECQWKKSKTSELWKNFLSLGEFVKYRPLHRLIPRIAMRSGLVDQYQLKWVQSENPNEIFKIADVNLLYSKIGLDYQLPVGKPTILIGPELRNIQTTSEGIFFKGQRLLSGAVHCSVLAPAKEKYPFLQFRILNKFNYLALCKSCTESLSQTCNHRSVNAKKFTSVWTVPDLNKALKEKYLILEIFEIVYFTERKYVLRKFVQALVSERLKNSGGLDGLETLEEKQKYCDSHNQKMDLPENFKLTVNNVHNNPGQKQFFKDWLNAIFGKFSSNLEKKKSEIVRSQKQLEHLAENYNITELFAINETNLLVEYEVKENKPNFKGNIFIGSEITAHARVFMHDYLKKLEAIKGVKIFSIETDCIMYSIPKTAIDPIPFSDQIGEFKSIIPLNCQVKSYFALGSKNYSILYQDSENKFHTILKVKGLSLTSAHVENLITSDTYNDYIESHFKNEIQNLTFPQIRKFVNKTSNYPETRFQTFEFRNDLYLKRYVVPVADGSNPGHYQTLPFGYKNN
jgi:hypothetical protein